MLSYWLFELLRAQETMSVMLNTSIAILTIFIPIAVALFFEPNEDRSYSALDKAVILDHLINGPQLLWQLSLLFLPLFLWQIKCLPLHFLVIVIWSVGVYLVIQKLGHVYTWIRGNKFPYRFAHLRSAPPNSEAENLWRSVWDTSDINRANEREFFNIFREKVSTALNKKDPKELDVLTKLLQDFEIFVDKRDVLFLTSPDDVFQQILDWHYQIWAEEQKRLGDSTERGLWRNFYTLSRSLDQTFKKILTRILKSNQLSYGFFKLLKKHTEKHLGDKVMVGDSPRLYVQELLGLFFPTFFNLIDGSSDEYEIWEHYFPQELKITESSAGHPPARIALWHYLQWARDRINRLKTEGGYDGALETVTMELFPGTEPIFWSIIMTLLLRSWGDKRRMRSLVEKERNFGFRGRIVSWSRNIDEPEPDTNALLQEQQETSLRSSISLLLKLFPAEFTVEKVHGYIQELEALSYNQDERKEAYRKQILEYIKRIKDSLN